METLRYNKGKAQVSHVLSFGKALWHVAALATQGAKKYSRDNWKNGGENTEKAALLDSLGRHLLAIGEGEEYDEDTGCLHMAAVAWNALAYIWHHYRDSPLVVHPNRVDNPEHYEENVVWCLDCTSRVSRTDPCVLENKCKLKEMNE